MTHTSFSIQYLSGAAALHGSKLGFLADANGCFQHKLQAMDLPAQDVSYPDTKFALVLVNYKLERPLMERLWWNATVRICADGAINRLYRLFDDDDEARSRFIPEYIRG